MKQDKKNILTERNKKANRVLDDLARDLGIKSGLKIGEKKKAIESKLENYKNNIDGYVAQLKEVKALEYHLQALKIEQWLCKYFILDNKKDKSIIRQDDDVIKYIHDGEEYEIKDFRPSYKGGVYSIIITLENGEKFEYLDFGGQFAVITDDNLGALSSVSSGDIYTQSRNKLGRYQALGSGWIAWKDVFSKLETNRRQYARLMGDVEADPSVDFRGLTKVNFELAQTSYNAQIEYTSRQLKATQSYYQQEFEEILADLEERLEEYGDINNPKKAIKKTISREVEGQFTELSYMLDSMSQLIKMLSRAIDLLSRRDKETVKSFIRQNLKGEGGGIFFIVTFALGLVAENFTDAMHEVGKVADIAANAVLKKIKESMDFGQQSTENDASSIFSKTYDGVVEDYKTQVLNFLKSDIAEGSYFIDLLIKDQGHVLKELLNKIADVIDTIDLDLEFLSETNPDVKIFSNARYQYKNPKTGSTNLGAEEVYENDSVYPIRRSEYDAVIRESVKEDDIPAQPVKKQDDKSRSDHNSSIRDVTGTEEDPAIINPTTDEKIYNFENYVSAIDDSFDIATLYSKSVGVAEETAQAEEIVQNEDSAIYPDIADNIEHEEHLTFEQQIGKEGLRFVTKLLINDKFAPSIENLKEVGFHEPILRILMKLGGEVVQKQSRNMFSDYVANGMINYIMRSTSDLNSEDLKNRIEEYLNDSAVLEQGFQVDENETDEQKQIRQEQLKQKIVYISAWIAAYTWPSSQLPDEKLEPKKLAATMRANMNGDLLKNKFNENLISFKDAQDSKINVITEALGATFGQDDPLIADALDYLDYSIDSIMQKTIDEIDRLYSQYFSLKKAQKEKNVNVLNQLRRCLEEINTILSLDLDLDENEKQKIRNDIENLNQLTQKQRREYAQAKGFDLTIPSAELKEILDTTKKNLKEISNKDMAIKFESLTSEECNQCINYYLSEEMITPARIIEDSVIDIELPKNAHEHPLIDNIFTNVIQLVANSFAALDREKALQLSEDIISQRPLAEITSDEEYINLPAAILSAQNAEVFRAIVRDISEYILTEIPITAKLLKDNGMDARDINSVSNLVGDMLFNMIADQNRTDDVIGEVKELYKEFDFNRALNVGAEIAKAINFGEVLNTVDVQDPESQEPQEKSYLQAIVDIGEGLTESFYDYFPYVQALTERKDDVKTYSGSLITKVLNTVSKYTKAEIIEGYRSKFFAEGGLHTLDLTEVGQAFIMHSNLNKLDIGFYKQYGKIPQTIGDKFTEISAAFTKFELNQQELSSDNLGEMFKGMLEEDWDETEWYEDNNRDSDTAILVKNFLVELYGKQNPGLRLELDEKLTNDICDEIYFILIDPVGLANIDQESRSYKDLPPLVKNLFRLEFKGDTLAPTELLAPVVEFLSPDGELNIIADIGQLAQDILVDTADLSSKLLPELVENADLIERVKGLVNVEQLEDEQKDYIFTSITESADVINNLVKSTILAASDLVGNISDPVVLGLYYEHQETINHLLNHTEGEAYEVKDLVELGLDFASLIDIRGILEEPREKVVRDIPQVGEMEEVDTELGFMIDKMYEESVEVEEEEIPYTLNQSIADMAKAVAEKAYSQIPYLPAGNEECKDSLVNLTEGIVSKTLGLVSTYTKADAINSIKAEFAKEGGIGDKLEGLLEIDRPLEIRDFIDVISPAIEFNNQAVPGYNIIADIGQLAKDILVDTADLSSKLLPELLENADLIERVKGAVNVEQLEDEQKDYIFTSITESADVINNLVKSTILAASDLVGNISNPEVLDLYNTHQETINALLNYAEGEEYEVKDLVELGLDFASLIDIGEILEEPREKAVRDIPQVGEMEEESVEFEEEEVPYTLNQSIADMAKAVAEKAYSQIPYLPAGNEDCKDSLANLAEGIVSKTLGLVSTYTKSDAITSIKTEFAKQDGIGDMIQHFLNTNQHQGPANQELGDAAAREYKEAIDREYSRKILRRLQEFNNNAVQGHKIIDDVSSIIKDNIEDLSQFTSSVISSFIQTDADAENATIGGFPMIKPSDWGVNILPEPADPEEKGRMRDEYMAQIANGKKHLHDAIPMYADDIGKLVSDTGAWAIDLASSLLSSDLIDGFIDRIQLPKYNNLLTKINYLIKSDRINDQQTGFFALGALGADATDFLMESVKDIIAHDQSNESLGKLSKVLSDNKEVIKGLLHNVMRNNETIKEMQRDPFMRGFIPNIDDIIDYYAREDKPNRIIKLFDMLSDKSWGIFPGFMRAAFNAINMAGAGLYAIGSGNVLRGIFKLIGIAVSKFYNDFLLPNFVRVDIMQQQAVDIINNSPQYDDLNMILEHAYTQRNNAAARYFVKNNDLSNLNLSEANLSNKVMDGVDFSNSILNPNFAGCTFQNVNFDNVEFLKTKMPDGTEKVIVDLTGVKTDGPSLKSLNKALRDKYSGQYEKISNPNYHDISNPTEQELINNNNTIIEHNGIKLGSILKHEDGRDLYTYAIDLRGTATQEVTVKITDIIRLVKLAHKHHIHNFDIMMNTNTKVLGHGSIFNPRPEYTATSSVTAYDRVEYMMRDMRISKAVSIDYTYFGNIRREEFLSTSLRVEEGTNTLIIDLNDTRIDIKFIDILSQEILRGGYLANNPNIQIHYDGGTSLANNDGEEMDVNVLDSLFAEKLGLAEDSIDMVGQHAQQARNTNGTPHTQDL